MFVKICGINSDEAVAAALEAGADALGFVFAASVRQVSAVQATHLARAARGRAWCVAVTRSPTALQIEQMFEVFAPDRWQTDHGDTGTLSVEAQGKVLPVFRENEPLPERLPDCLLFEGAQSGVGRTADWEQARRLATRTRLILAGGLHPGNVADAIHRVKPWGVDASSGVEASPGRKCPQKIHEFVKTARAAFEEISE